MDREIRVYSKEELVCLKRHFPLSSDIFQKLLDREICRTEECDQICLAFLQNHNQSANRIDASSATYNAPRINSDVIVSRRRTISIEQQDMSLETLKELYRKSDGEVLLTFCTQAYGFERLLNNLAGLPDEHGILLYILVILGKASSHHLTENVKSLMTTVRSHETFIPHVRKWLQSLESFESEESKRIFTVPIYMVHKFLVNYKKHFPECISKTIANLMSDLESAEQRTGLQFNFVRNTNSENCHNNFRSVPIFPSQGDLIGPEPFLRPNREEGKYSSIEEYLDTHFRLLLEDYVSSLRTGLSSYLKKEPTNACRVHQNVTIEEYGIDKFGCLQFTARFPDDPLDGMCYQSTKRFLHGWLLCFSCDNFKTFMLATVENREGLSSGTLKLKFEDIPEIILRISPLQKFEVLETTVYFEAYRHTLFVLKLKGEDNFPMKEYIIDVELNTNPPPYITPNLRYNFRCLLPSGEPDCEHDTYVEVLNDSEWPNSSTLGLDDSQLKALKAAITTKFALIQGPPGTGKTFLGLRIVQLLLANKRIYETSDSPSPILVVCYTNHALDQFLEGTLKFTNRIVRVGSKFSKSLEPFQLNKENSLVKNAVIPEYIENSLNEQRNVLDSLKEKMEWLKHQINDSASNIYNEITLKNIMGKLHYDNLLLSFVKSELEEGVDDFGDFIIPIWLHIPLHEESKLPQVNNSHDATELSDVEQNSTSTSLNILDDLFNEDNITSDDLSNEVESSIFDKSEPMMSPNDQEETDKAKHDKAISEKAAEYVASHLENNSAMSKEEATSIQNVWSLDIEDRWRLYKYWIGEYVLSLKKIMLQLERQLQIEILKFKERLEEKNFYLLRNTDIVGMTTTGAAIHKNIVQELGPKIVLVEEAAVILEAHVVVSLAKNTQHVILIGDHQQLRPITTEYKLDATYNLGISLFERMIRNRLKFQRLSVQHRMRPSIASLIHPFYSNLKNHESVLNFDDIRGVQKNVCFISHTFEERQEPGSNSRVNQHEASFLIELYKYLLHQGYSSSQITILTGYSGQETVLCRQLSDVRIVTIDNFQGEENDIILVSFVRSNLEGNIGFIKVSNRICVALSRARKGLYCIGNFQQLAEQCKWWREIVMKLNNDNAVRPSLSLRCLNHGAITEVYLSEDFEKVANGGCSLPCNYRLKCSHTCSQLCHPYRHDEVLCNESCLKILCNEGHKCPRKCYEDCPRKCVIKVPKYLPRCGHTETIDCSLPAQEHNCTQPCEKTLVCGHACVRQCAEPCSEFKCSERVVTKLKCGHGMTVECWKLQRAENDLREMDYLLESCEKPCATVLKCDHVCLGTCGKCQQGNSHIICTQSCRLLLDCKHQCASKCGEDCSKSQCTVIVSVKLSCGHEVTTMCWKSSNTEDLLETCTNSCQVKLDCGHIYTGTCGGCYKLEHHEDGHLPPKKFTCQERCEKDLPCGHPCGLRCGVDCSAFKCEAVVTKVIKCGHEMSRKCYEFSSSSELFTLTKFCENLCSATLPCGHTCLSSCSNCKQGRLHKACHQKCNRILVCGHSCGSNCYEACPPCKRTCKRSCPHGKCSHRCSDACRVCTKPCQWACKHKRCTKKCGEVCDREPCILPCKKLLKCGHPCLGLCGEPCPKLCLICKPAKIYRQFINPMNYATKQAKARFVELSDCKHIFELDEITLYLKDDEPRNRIPIKSCPICKTVIKSTHRFGNSFKDALSIVAEVREGVLDIKNFFKNVDIIQGMETIRSKDRENFLLKLRKTVETKQLSYGQTVSYINLVDIIEDLLKILRQFPPYFQYMFSNYFFFGKSCVLPDAFKINIEHLIDFSRQTYQLVNDFVRYDYRRCSHQEVNDVAWEVQRFKCQCKLMDIIFKRQYSMKPNDIVQESCCRMVQLLCKLGPFRSVDEKEFKKEFVSFCGELGIFKTITPKTTLLKAIDYTTDQWFDPYTGD